MASRKVRVYLDSPLIIEVDEDDVIGDDSVDQLVDDLIYEELRGGNVGWYWDWAE